MLLSPHSTGLSLVSMVPAQSPWLLLEFGVPGIILTPFPGVENAPTFAKEEAAVVTVLIKAFPVGEYFEENSPHLSPSRWAPVRVQQPSSEERPEQGIKSFLQAPQEGPDKRNFCLCPQEDRYKAAEQTSGAQSFPETEWKTAGKLQ